MGPPKHKGHLRRSSSLGRFKGGSFGGGLASLVESTSSSVCLDGCSSIDLGGVTGDGLSSPESEGSGVAGEDGAGEDGGSSSS